MPPSSPEPAVPVRQPSHGPASGIATWIAVVISAVVLVWFFGIEKRYEAHRGASVTTWLMGAWNYDLDYEHGPLVPLVAIGLIVYRFKALKAAAGDGNVWGLVVILLGVAFYAAGYRTLQPRITAGSLPFILWGSAIYLWGWQMSRMLIFPLFFLWLAIPLPSFQQATTHLQLVATAMAHHGSGLFGVETYVEGTKVLPVTGDWKPLDIAAGCSGIRSLMALLMISAAWAYVAKISLWKKAILFFAAFPLAILGNSLRVISIFVIAEYGNEEWARTTWHDWSGLLLFYPFSLALLLLLHTLLEGGWPWKKGNRRQVRRVVVTHTNEPKNFIPES